MEFCCAQMLTERQASVLALRQVVCLALREHLGTTEFHLGKVTTEHWQWALFVPALVVDHCILEHACHSKILRQNQHES